MRRSNQSVFNEFFTVSASPVYTSTELNAKLGHFDQLAIQVIIDNFTASTTGNFDLWIEHSADGRNFLPVNGSNYSTGTGDIAKSGLTSGTAYNYFVANSGSTPFLGYVRFRMAFAGTGVSGHVHVLVTQRDQGG